MKKVILILTLLFSFNITAQVSIHKMQLKHNGFIAVDLDSINNYIVIKFQKKTQSELYKATLVYLNSIYKNPKSVLNVVENEAIVINGATNAIKSNLYWEKYIVNYSIKILFKDSKIKFEPVITDFNELDDNYGKIKMFIANTDSPKKAEINCIFMTDKDFNYFVFKKDIKNSLENWINNYIANLITGINKNDW